MKHKAIIKKAKVFCENNSFRLTDPRERVLSLLSKSSTPMTAYQILEALSSAQTKIRPPTVYRAIDFWLTNKFIHRIESLKSYIVCCTNKRHDDFLIFICNACNHILELQPNNLTTKISNELNQNNMIVTSTHAEVRGICDQCSA